jgi:hypothetical protein
VTPFLAVLLGGFLFMLVSIDLMLLGPMVFVATLLIVLAALFVVRLARRPQERRK